MLKAIIFIMIGGALGFLFAALMVAAKDEKEKDNLSDWIEYKCKNNVHKCGDLCCWMCIAAHNCPDVCKNTPQKCNRSVIYLK